MDDKNKALATTRFVLLELAKYMAPFTPFFSEYLYGELKSESDPESVHLCSFPVAGEVDEEVLKNMEIVRKVVSLGLEKRNTVNIKVRQPLSKLVVKSVELDGKQEYLELIQDEVNVKEIKFDEGLEPEVELDINITPELKIEGEVRELIRAIQELRKEGNLTPDNKIILQIETGEEGRSFVETNKSEISKPTNISDFEFTPNSGTELKIGEIAFKISLK
jgi:isoleucyl-tRNA synthetase